MFKKFFSALTILIFCATITSVAQIKIGVLDVQKVMSEVPQMEQIQNELDNYISQKRQELQNRTAGFQDSVAEYQENQAAMSQQQQAAREKELAAMEQELRTYQQNLQSEIQQYRQQLLSPVYADIDSAIANIAESMDLDFVLNKSTSSGQEIVRYVGKDRLDITEEVIKRIKSNSNKN